LIGIARLPRLRARARGQRLRRALLRTLKENLLWVRRFATIEELRLASLEFQRTYKQTWIVERHGYQTLAAVRAAQLAPLPAAA
jgi:hypothetical protein